MTHAVLIRYKTKSYRTQQKTHKDAILSTDWLLTYLTQSSKSHTCFYLVHFCVGLHTNIECHKRTILYEYKTILCLKHETDLCTPGNHRLSSSTSHVIWISEACFRSELTSCGEKMETAIVGSFLVGYIKR